MARFQILHMRAKAPDDAAMVINTCGRNDTAELGDAGTWVWANPTNRRYMVKFDGRVALSTECLWQGLKVFGTPDLKEANTTAFQGNWRLGKGKRPLGHWSRDGLIDTQAEARRRIYVPAYVHQLWSWLRDSPEARTMVRSARTTHGTVYLRDFDTGQSLLAPKPMSHAWVLSCILNDGEVPDAEHDDADKARLEQITEWTT